MDSEEYGLGTLLAHFGEDEKLEGAVTPPIFQNSLFLFDHAEDLFKSMSNMHGAPYHYSRISNPTLDIVENKLAKLEGTEAAKVLGSGMAALSVALMSNLEQGSHMVVVDTAYGPVRSDLANYLKKFGVSMTLVDGRDPSEVIDAFRPETTALYLESPSSILMRLQDIDAITAETRQRKISTVFDNTYNTPVHFQPAAHGIDLVCHSATKYLGGHSDLTAGVICGSRERIDRITRQEINVLGNILHPFQAWLLHRGMRTLKVRIKAHEATANTVAAFIESLPEVELVNHISLASYPQKKLYEQMLTGSGGLFSFQPKVQERARIMEFCDSLKLFGRGVSWGGFESLVVPINSRTITNPNPTWVIRLYCGLEEPEDLIRDIRDAFCVLS
jgi:cystathionine beta-lyase/cystathionine gamma-synthase